MLSPRWQYDHKIGPTKDYVPQKSRPYSMMIAEENFQKGFIHESKSPQAAPLFFIPKNGKLRPCKDYWYLNKFTVKNAYPIP
jgi:hypothetical protein